MSSHRSAVINGLLAENFGKNDLVRHAESNARDARSKANDAAHESEMAQIKLNKAKREIAQLQEQVAAANQEASAYKELLSRPMREIAGVSGDFKKAYEMQQQLLAEWIMGQKAYRETAMQLGIKLEMTPEQVQKAAAPNFTAVLENRTQHGNDAKDIPLLAQHAEAILALRKKNGKA